MDQAENSAKTAKSAPQLVPYRFQKGHTGNANGRPRKTPIADMLVKCLTKSELKDLARAAIKHAKSGKGVYFQEIADRVDGKVVQQHKHDGLIVHELTAVEKQSALKSLSKITAYDSDAENPIEVEYEELP